jgi:hypothetical protein
MAPLMRRFLNMNGFGQITVPVTVSVLNIFAVLATLSVVLDKNGTVSVS